MQEAENRCGKHSKDASARVVVCLDCSSKRATVWVAETAGVSCLTDLEARSARPGVHRVSFFQGLRGESVQVSPFIPGGLLAIFGVP